MHELIEQYKKSGHLHHAYLLEGEKDTLLPAVLSFVGETLGISVRGNPDVLVHTCETLTIEESRFIENLEGLRALKGGKKIFVIAFDFMTREAQNALLKLLEEPLSGTHFFLITSLREVLLPTLLSRLQIILGGSAVGNDELAQHFLSRAPGKRMELLKDIVENRDRAAARVFLDTLERILYRRSSEDAAVKEDFGSIMLAKKYLGDQSASVKMLLEHVSLSL